MITILYTKYLISLSETSTNPCVCVTYFVYIFLPDKWFKRRSFLFVHSGNKSHSYVYLKFICLSEKCKQSKSSIAIFTYRSLSNILIVSLLPQHWTGNFSARYSISSVSDCFPNWLKRSQPCTREFWNSAFLVETLLVVSHPKMYFTNITLKGLIFAEIEFLVH